MFGTGVRASVRWNRIVLCARTVPSVDPTSMVGSKPPTCLMSGTFDLTLRSEQMSPPTLRPLGSTHWLYQSAFGRSKSWAICRIAAAS